MREGARLFVAAGLAIALGHSNVLADKIRLAQTSTVTNCMMSCNSQAANCQAACVVPGTPPTGAATAAGNANKSTSCQLSCTTPADQLPEYLRANVAVAVAGVV